MKILFFLSVFASVAIAKSPSVVLTEANPEGPSLVSQLSQKTYEVFNQDFCQKASQNETLKLSHSERECHRATPAIANLEAYDQLTENLFFEKATNAQIEAYDCLRAQVAALQSPATPAANTKFDSAQIQKRQSIAQDFALKIPKLRALTKELEATDLEAMAIEKQQLASPTGEAVITKADQKKYRALRQRQLELRKGLEILQQSLWQGQNHFVRTLTQSLIKAKNFDAEKFRSHFVERDNSSSTTLDGLIAQISNEMTAQKTELAAKKSLTDKDKVRLFMDQHWIGPVSSAFANDPQSLRAITCRMEGRYGKGRERFYTAAQIGSTAALTLVPGGLLFAAGRGFVAVTVARTLALASSASVSALSLATTYEQRCPRSSLTSQVRTARPEAACRADSVFSVESLQHENCALDVALAALDIPFPELKSASVAALAFGMTRQEGKLLRNPQLEIWRAREAGKFADAQKLESEITRVLKEAPMEVKGMVGEGKSGAFFVDFGNGVEGVWKPSTGKVASAHNEIAAARIDELLGTELVPVTVPRSLHNIEGTVQVRVQNLTEQAHDWRPDRLSYFDYLLGNSDRHPENYLMTKDGHMVAIDHGLAFREAPPIKQMKILNESLEDVTLFTKRRASTENLLQKALANGETPERIANLKQTLLKHQQAESIARTKAKNLTATMIPSATMISRLKLIRREDWDQLLGDVLSPSQLEALAERQKTILASVERAESVLGKDIVPSGPNSPLVKKVFDGRELEGP